MSNDQKTVPWTVSLRKTGYNEKRITDENNKIQSINDDQDKINDLKNINREKKDMFDDRQASKSVDAMMGKQGRLGGKSKKNRKRKTRKNRKSKKRRNRKN
jgi:hypothetical protein